LGRGGGRGSRQQKRESIKKGERGKRIYWSRRLKVKIELLGFLLKIIFQGASRREREKFRVAVQ